MLSQRLLSLAVGCLLLAGATSPASAITTSGGQAWNFVPDAWTRGNTDNASYFGWDVIEHAGLPNGPMGTGRLDDTTPDLGAPTTATSPRIVQSAASLALFGHRSGTGNYYSGFQGIAYADDTISAVAPTPAGQTGGFTTVVLQVIGQPNNAVADLSFAADTSSVAWTKQKDLFAVNETGAGVYWQEWTAPGDNLPFSIHMASATSSRGLDAFQVDAFWSPTGPVINAISAIPEPTSAALASMGLLGLVRIVRRRSLAFSH
ncbi:MAG: hypothetical protein H0T51_02075 [Pirellulales bacterium]|nr:hypothetical protein [Pirellulales bacterium]